MTQNIIRINPETLPNSSEMGYSQISVVEPGRMAYISGQVAWTSGGEPVPEGLVEQIEVIGKNIKAALNSVAATVSNVVLVRVYVVDLTPERLEELMPAFLTIFEGVQPCVTGVGVSALAVPDLKVELELVVRLPD